MKRDWLGLLVFLFFLFFAEQAGAASTCGGGAVVTPEEKIRAKVDAAKIDYQINPDGLREKLIKEIGEAVSEEKEKISWLVYAALPDIFVKNDLYTNVIAAAIKDKTENVSLNADLIMDPDLTKKYGNYFLDAQKKVPKLVDFIKEAKKDFKPEDLGVAFPNKTYQLGDGRIIVFFSGCTPQNCSGTENRIAYDEQNNKAYVLTENADQTKIYIFGSPDKEIQRLLFYDYLYQ